jgi:hypothetical protein
MSASEPVDVHRDTPHATDAQLMTTVPEGVYLVVNAQGELVRRVGDHPARLLARVRKVWGRTPRGMVRVYMRIDSRQVLWQWEDRDGAWPEDLPTTEADVLNELEARTLDVPPPEDDE